VSVRFFWEILARIRSVRWQLRQAEIILLGFLRLCAQAAQEWFCVQVVREARPVGRGVAVVLLL